MQQSQSMQPVAQVRSAIYADVSALPRCLPVDWQDRSKKQQSRQWNCWRIISQEENITSNFMYRVAFINYRFLLQKPSHIRNPKICARTKFKKKSYIYLKLPSSSSFSNISFQLEYLCLKTAMYYFIWNGNNLAVHLFFVSKTSKGFMLKRQNGKYKLPSYKIFPIRIRKMLNNK